MENILPQKITLSDGQEVYIRPKIYQAIPKIMSEVGFISKGRTNQAQGYKFRGIDDVYSAFQKALSSNGVFYVPTILEIERSERATKSGGVNLFTLLKIKYTFYADDGSSVESVVVGEAMDTSDKSSNKAMSAALKYALLQIFCIPTDGDNDTENSHHELSSEEKDCQALEQQLFKLLSDSGKDVTEKVREWASNATKTQLLEQIEKHSKK